MKKIEVKIRNKAGLHARPSALFVQTANEYLSDVMIKSGTEEVNGKSIMGLMLLAAEKGRKIEITADGEDEEKVLEALKKLVEEDKFGEE
ncbi:HPr family phosphocarrier protein [Haliovirga abyssi]|uniref:Phosphocarrier protein HPr n=1 Tax=Haliovirga abyssi TaxID=2996794 RepID=A0AAU9D5Q0_9FUSO|nr:HPr family phosphocarrier protein [Haliovirga abyssi]BDU49878.1 phosphocarrier protein HPr [Haliovirga abyssi]